MEFRPDTLRLTQLWRFRFERMLSLLPKLRGQPAPLLFRAEFFEAVGWLAEGVFCGYFDPHEANVVLVLISPLRDFCGQPETPLNGSLSEKVWGTEWSQDPFRETLQMPSGAQKEFELPLFGHALLLADRFSEDRLAGICTHSIYDFDDGRWSDYKKAWPLVKAIEVDQMLNNPETATVNLECLSAGYIRLLEHMGTSKDFFDYAKSRSNGRDFDSYLVRIGGLNGWRIPLDNEHLSLRFHELRDLFEFTARPALRSEYPDVDWSTLAEPFALRLKVLVAAWESYHLLGSLVS